MVGGSGEKGKRGKKNEEKSGVGVDVRKGQLCEVGDGGGEWVMGGPGGLPPFAHYGLISAIDT